MINSIRKISICTRQRMERAQLSSRNTPEAIMGRLSATPMKFGEFPLRILKKSLKTSKIARLQVTRLIT